MFFPWHKYEELELGRRNTLQIFITNKCNLKCAGCFARNVMKEDGCFISTSEYFGVINNAKIKGCHQINILGGEPLLHPNLKKILDINKNNDFKTTIYTNGYFLNNYTDDYFEHVKLRVSLCSNDMNVKDFNKIPKTDIRFDANFMVSAKTTVDDLLKCSNIMENNYNCKKIFISSFRELDNKNKEFFEDTELTAPVIKYKKLVHEFLNKYNGNLNIDVSKRGVFESTKTLPDTKCRFANYFIGGKIIQCPYDVVNLKFQNDYSFGVRNCQHNNTCLMSKIKLVKR